jgi:hypothetical protein
MTTDRAADSPQRVIRPLLAPAILGALLLAVGALLVDTEWYTLIRYAISILALITAVLAVQHRRWVWALPLVPIAIVWNPVWPLGFSGPLWLAAHYLAGVLFLVVGMLVRVREEPPRRG